MLTITKEFSFAYGHRLYNNCLTESENKNEYGPCTNIHGHNSILRVTVASLNSDESSNLVNGMIINFSVLKEIVNTLIISKLDHRFLNELVSEIPDFPSIPTCENIIQWIHKTLQPALKEYNVKCVQLDLYETPTSYATWKE